MEVQDNKQNTEIALANRDIQHIKEALGEIKNNQKTSDDKMQNFISAVNKLYATKEEVKELRTSVRAAITTAIVGIIGFLVEAIFLLINMKVI